jgi:uncharacterized membrane protein
MLTGTIVDKLTGENDYVPFIMFIAVGIGLIVSFYVREKLNKKEGE